MTKENVIALAMEEISRDGFKPERGYQEDVIDIKGPNFIIRVNPRKIKFMHQFHGDQLFDIAPEEFQDIKKAYYAKE